MKASYMSLKIMIIIFLLISDNLLDSKEFFSLVHATVTRQDTLAHKETQLLTTNESCVK